MNNVKSLKRQVLQTRHIESIEYLLDLTRLFKYSYITHGIEYFYSLCCHAINVIFDMMLYANNDIKNDEDFLCKCS